MIYLGINDNHLLCAQWVNDDGKFLLTSVTQKPFQKSIFDSNRTENEIISDNILQKSENTIQENTQEEEIKEIIINE